ncbi:PLAC8-domain-containing protein [Glonium stellatum]|uniref:PLAC8-domain-containing protein n=1 Tax=Glonium stellatum TaxID=574774 RepID=A0A8E2JV35_9PEZI|nr:PLAC8-domain-containing protein [Glonium stellatum]
MDPRQNPHYRAQRQPQQTERQDNRFSWQIPIDESDGQQGQPGRQLSVDTSFQNTPQHRNMTRARDGRYSEQSSPIELQQASNGQFPRSRPIETMAASPITPIDLHPQDPTTNLIQPHGSPSQYPPEKTGGSPYNISPPQQIHPAMFAPIVESPARSQASSTYYPLSQQQPHPIPQGPRSPLREPASPLPQKSPVSPPSSPGPVPIKRDYAHIANAPQSTPPQPKEPYSPYGTQSPVHAVFSPDASLGPNGLNTALHQPGQIAHPNMDLSNTGSDKEWKHSLCDCGGDVGTCLTGLFCPCILYGKTSYRLSQKSSKKDPTDLLGYSATNSQCVVMSAACGLWCLFPLIQRTRLRHIYKLAGSITGDIGRACCCCCCVTIQNEREVRDREENARRWAGPAAHAEAYSRPEQMVYAPPPRG